MINLRAKKIAVLMGGPGSERLVSHASGQGVTEALRSLGAQVTAVDVTGPDFVLPEGTELAFNVIHGTFGEDGQLQRILEERGIPYTGEGVAESEICIDKIKTKELLVQHGVPTPASETLVDGADPTIPVPLVVKAPCEGSSVGVYIVREASELPNALAEARKLSPVLLVEQYITARELTVGIVGGKALPIIEIKAKKDFYNFENKYPFLNPNAAGADHTCPAHLTPEETRLVQEVAVKATEALGLKVYSRADVLLSTDGQPYVIEVNTIPGMTPSSLLPEAAAAQGVSYAHLCAQIIELSLAARPRA
jgi:D-alanine-D-alanine ligase